MIWALAILALFLIVGFFGHRAEKRADAKFVRDLADAVDYYSARILQNEIRVSNPQVRGYHPVRGETVLAILESVVDHDTKVQGRLIITDRAFIFESQVRSERLVYTALSNVEAKRDGVEIRRRKGPRRAYRLDDAKLLGLMVAAFRTQHR